MKKAILVPAAAILALLAACEAKVGEGKGSDANSSAEGKAEANAMSISAPGFAMKVSLPEGVRKEANLDSDDELFYPGASLGGMHIEASGQGGVELRFNSADTIAKVADWYRDGSRTGFTIDTSGRDGEAYLFSGHAGDEKKPFKLRLQPSGTGTEGILAISDNR